MSRSNDHASWQRWEMGRLERREARQPSPEVLEQHNIPQRREDDDARREAFEKARQEGFEQGRREGHDAGYAAGLEAGREQAQQEYQLELESRLHEALAPVADMVNAFDAAAGRLKDDIAYTLVELALETGRQLAGRSLELAPEHILDDIEKLMMEHPTLGGTPRICVHPDDLVMVQKQLSTLLGDAGWQLKSDSSLSRGDCRLETDQIEIDATRDDRWERLRHAVGHGKH
ncbi:flagellar assembly protein FliH [Kushneria indalinina]|uniref:Flagellar assembly protein FliH n=1 Tax=Kushneria indalinina DSM 14324 TaxID=1122140 RepID=A0A3D9E1I5_9GAMM|nr:flagellar assembly protein FliH [Kushneria indalinina]REC96324.1 flagellar assembly protein FliH [Kushneria indalinina DSM 14324]